MKFSKSVKKYIASIVVTAIATKITDMLVEKIAGDGKSRKKKKNG